MLEVQTDKLNLRKWEEFSVPRDTDKTIRLFHKGQNGLLLFVTENDDVYIAQKDGHKRVNRLCGRNIVRFANTLNFIVAGTERNEILFISVDKTIDATELELSYFGMTLLSNDCKIFSVVPKSCHGGSFFLLGCCEYQILTLDKLSDVQTMFCLSSLGNNCYSLIPCKVIKEATELPDVKLSFGFGCYKVVAVGKTNSSVCVTYGMHDDWGIPSEFRVRSRVLPFASRNVACARDNVALLLENGDVIMQVGSRFYLLEIPPVTEISSNGDFFAVSTNESIIRIVWDETLKSATTTTLEGVNNLLQAFEGQKTPPTCIRTISNGPLREKSGNDPTTRTESVVALYDTDRLSDITLLLEDGKMPAHKVILSMYSRFFDKLFKSDDWKTKTDNSILDVSSYSSAAYRAYIRLIYHGDLKWSDFKCDQLLDVYKIAAENEEDFERDVLAFLMGSVDSKNVFKVFKFAVEAKLKSLEDECLQVAKNHKIDVMVSESYITMSFDLRRRLAEFVLK